jgi:hypothetical protein
MIPDQSMPDDLKPGWLPGIYQDPAGGGIAIHAAAQPIADPPPSDWQQRLKSLPPAERSRLKLARPLLVASLLLLVLSAIAWPARRAASWRA